MQATRIIQSALLIAFCLDSLGDKKLQRVPLMDEKEVVKRFDAHVREYVELHNQQEAILPKLKSTDSPEKIKEYQNALAEGIRSVRKNAQPGDIFTWEVREYFIVEVHKVFHGPVGPDARLTVKQGEPLKGHIDVNQPYPDGVPLTTVPPTLLLSLPKLPQELRYGII